MKHNLTEAEKRMDRYLSGRMLISERKDFEKELRADPELQTAFSDYKMEREGLQLIAYQSYLDEIRASHQSAIQTDRGGGEVIISDAGTGQKSKVALYRRLWPYASAAAVVLLLLWIFTADLWQASHTNQLPDDPQLLAHYLADSNGKLIASAPGISRGGDSNDPEMMNINWRQVDSLFREKRFSEVVSLLSPLRLNSLDDHYKYLLGVSHFQTEQFQQSANCFRTLIDSGWSEFHNQAEAFLVLSLLAEGLENSEEFRQLLVGILSKPGHLFYEQAAIIRDRLQAAN